MRAETRRQLKQDKFSKATLQVAEQTVHWSVEHKGKLIAAAAVVVVVVAGFAVVRRRESRPVRPNLAETPAS